MNKLGRTLLFLAIWLMVGGMALPAAAHGPDDEEGHHDADPSLPAILESARFDQRLGEKAPLDLTFTDDSGQTVRLGDYFGGDKPVMLTLNYYECDNLCPLMLEGLVRALKVVPFTVGNEYDVVTVSIDERETPELATEVKKRVIDRYDRVGKDVNWPFLTGNQAAIEQLAQAVGYNFEWDEKSQQYAHPSGVIILTPDGTIARYIYGLDFSPRDLRLALVEASEGEIATPIDQILLFCFHYDPSTGKYSAIAMNSMRLGGLATLLALGAFIVPMVRRDRQQSDDKNPKASE